MKQLSERLLELTNCFEVKQELDHLNYKIYLKFINRFDDFQYEYQLYFWEFKNFYPETENMISELKQIKTKTEREHKLSLIL